MSRYKKYIETSVVDEAAKRLDYIFAHFDNVSVMFSGGKDSLVTLHLARAAATRAGCLPLDVIFLDEEIIPPSVVEFVKGYHGLDWCRLHWFAVPMEIAKAVLGTVEMVTAWEPGREHMHQPPEYAIRLPPDDGRVFMQQTMDGFVSEHMNYRGLTAHLQGIRAQESITRYRACVNKMHLNYINASTQPQVKLGKPIYDWTQNDIFAWLGREGIAWCSAYEAQYLAGHELRVATPLHGEASRKFAKLGKADPKYVEAIRERWPEMDMVTRYHDQYDATRVETGYTDGMSGCWRYIQAHFYGEKKRQAQKIFSEYSTHHRRDPVAYPAQNLLRHITRGVVHRLPQSDTGARNRRRKAMTGNKDSARV